MKIRDFSDRRFYMHVENDSDIVVQNDLAVTPAQMLDMQARGIPISAQMNSSVPIINQLEDNGFDVPIEFTRGFDLVTAYEKSQESKSKIIRADFLNQRNLNEQVK